MKASGHHLMKIMLHIFRQDLVSSYNSTILQLVGITSASTNSQIGEMALIVSIGEVFIWTLSTIKTSPKFPAITDQHLHNVDPTPSTLNLISCIHTSETKKDNIIRMGTVFNANSSSWSTINQPCIRTGAGQLIQPGCGGAWCSGKSSRARGEGVNTV